MNASEFLRKVENDISIKIKKEAYLKGEYEKLEVTEKQFQALKILNNLSTKFLLYGGAAGGGKSWLGCEWLFWMCICYPGTKWFIGREELKRITQSTYITFQKVASKHGYKLGVDYKYNGQYNYIYFPNGSRIDFLDLRYMPRDPMYERFGSVEYTGGWIEEGGETNFGAYDVLKSRVNRHLNKELGIKSKILITCNPKRNWLYTYYYKPWTKDQLKENQEFIQAFVDDNDFIHGEYVTDLEEIQDESKRERLRWGNWEYDGDPTVLMDYEAVDDVFFNDHVKEDENDKWITADIALEGSDKLVIGVWYGWVLVEVQEFEKTKGNQVIAEIEKLKIKHGVPNSRIIYDSDGVGGFAGGFIRNSKSFVNNSGALNKENYENLKTQCYYKLSGKVNEYGLFLKCLKSPSIQEYAKEELLQVKSRDGDKDGKLKILRKEDVKKNIGRSPDYGDMIMMRMYPTLRPKPQKRKVTIINL